MKNTILFAAFTLSVASIAPVTFAEEGDAPQVKATIDGSEPGWTPLGEADFVNVNCAADTWSWKDGQVHCTGKPVGVLRSQKIYTNFELLAEWQHLSSGGNSGIFVWTPEGSLKDLPPPGPDQLFEITLEPAAGSPTGRPTGPVLFKGALLQTAI
jgi:hypothetical protein